MPAPTKSQQSRTDRPGVDLVDERRSIEVLRPLSVSPWWMPAPATSDQFWILSPLALTAVWTGAAWTATAAAGAIVTQAVLWANPVWVRVAAEVVQGARAGLEEHRSNLKVEVLKDVAVERG